MKPGAENRKKTVMLGIFGAIALCGVIYDLTTVFGGSDTPPPAIAPVAANSAHPRPGLGGAPPPDFSSSTGGSSRNAAGGSNAIPGVAAQRVASTSASLDPTLDQAAMLRTESLVYSGSGRNIFSATFVAPVAAIPTRVPPPRPVAPPPVVAPVNLGPPPPPPIPLKFFGTAQREHGEKQAFLLSGDDVYLASAGDIVAKRFRVGQITSFGVQVTDLGSNNTQTLPLQQQ